MESIIAAASTGLERVSMDGTEYLYNGLFAMR